MPVTEDGRRTDGKRKIGQCSELNQKPQKLRCCIVCCNISNISIVHLDNPCVISHLLLQPTLVDPVKDAGVCKPRANRNMLGKAKFRTEPAGLFYQ